MESENIKEENVIINEIYKKLESNKLISYNKNNNNKINKDIILKEKEKLCFSTIIDILNKNNLNSIICRVAGGWVRDKLLGKENEDIDIVINDIKGSKLAQIINEELYPNNTKYGIFQQNPEKEKNIEIVNIIIFDTSIDITNFRCEDLNKIGTSLSDAELRDFTINSLFYNINEKKVEDLTQKGIKDLEKGLIDTPLKPEKSFSIQYFAILRMLRFAIKFKFTISNEVNNFVEKNGEEIINKFYKNISKERIGKELLKIISFDNSAFAISYLYYFNILDIIFLIKNYDSKNKYDKLFLKVANIYILGEYLLKNYKIFDIEINSDNLNKIHYSLLLLTLYFRDKTISNAYINQQITKHTYKLGNEYQNPNNLMCRNFDNILHIINEEQFERIKIGKLIRKLTHKNILSILYAGIAYEYIEIVKLNSLLEEIDNEILDKLISKYKKFFNYIIKQDLLYIDKMEPLFTGKDLMAIFNMKPNGKIGFLLQYLIEQQIKDPKLDKNIAIELLKKKKEEIMGNNTDNLKEISNNKSK